MKFLYDPIKGFNNIPPPPGVAFAQEFGIRPEVYAQFGLAGHNGIDIAAPKGTPILAPCDGWICEQTSKDTGYGLRITMRAENQGQYFQLVFGHMERLENPVTFPYDWNDKTRPVQTGQVIGYVNSTGFSTGNHLHLTLTPKKINGENAIINNYGGAVDPVPYMFMKDAPMNQAKIVKSKKSPSIYVCYEMPDMTYLQTKANIEGFIIPANVPDTDSL